MLIIDSSFTVIVSVDVTSSIGLLTKENIHYLNIVRWVVCRKSNGFVGLVSKCDP